MLLVCLRRQRCKHSLAADPWRRLWQAGCAHRARAGQRDFRRLDLLRSIREFCVTDGGQGMSALGAAAKAVKSAPGPVRIAIVTNIPVPYREPVLESLALEPDLDLHVFFCSDREPN